jgi:hypothetical protein
MVCVILGQIGFNPLTLFVSLSSVVLAFAFSKSAPPFVMGKFANFSHYLAAIDVSDWNCFKQGKKNGRPLER